MGVHGPGMAHGAGRNRRDAGGVLRCVRRQRAGDGPHCGSRVPRSRAEASALPDVERRLAWMPSGHRDARSKSSERRSARPHQPRDPQGSSRSVGRPRARVPSHGRRRHHARKRASRRGGRRRTGPGRRRCGGDPGRTDRRSRRSQPCWRWGPGHGAEPRLRRPRSAQRFGHGRAAAAEHDGPGYGGGQGRSPGTPRGPGAAGRGRPGAGRRSARSCSRAARVGTPAGPHGRRK
jgi:hypothetical protein